MSKSPEGFAAISDTSARVLICGNYRASASSIDQSRGCCNWASRRAILALRTGIGVEFIKP